MEPSQMQAAANILSVEILVFQFENQENPILNKEGTNRVYLALVCFPKSLETWGSPEPKRICLIQSPTHVNLLIPKSDGSLNNLANAWRERLGYKKKFYENSRLLDDSASTTIDSTAIDQTSLYPPSTDLSRASPRSIDTSCSSAYHFNHFSCNSVSIPFNRILRKLKCN